MLLLVQAAVAVAILVVAPSASALSWLGSNKMGGELDQNGTSVTWTGFNDKHSRSNMIGTRFPAKSVKSKGDSVTINMVWISNGTNTCPEQYWGKSYKYSCQKRGVQQSCAPSSPRCLAGTGDFRVFVGDSRGHNLTSGYAYSDLRHYGGYNFRIFPHAASKAHYYIPRKGSPKPGSAVVPSAVYSSVGKGPFGSHRVWPSSSSDKRRAPGGFNLPMGARSYFRVKLTRCASTRMSIEFEMHSPAHLRKVTHRWRSAQTKNAPNVIDSIFIGYPNRRDYSSLEVGFDGNGAVVHSSSSEVHGDAVMPFTTSGTNSTVPQVPLALSVGDQGGSNSPGERNGTILSA